jgi:hypothetical protein
MTAFGARSATTLLHRLTVGAFVGFVVTTLAIAYMQANVQGTSVLSGARTGVTQIPPDAEAPSPDEAPAAAGAADATPPVASPSADRPESESSGAEAPPPAPN